MARWPGSVQALFGGPGCFGEVSVLVNRLRGAKRRHGLLEIKKRDRRSMQMPHPEEWLPALFACYRCGASSAEWIGRSPIGIWPPFDFISGYSVPKARAPCRDPGDRLDGIVFATCYSPYPPSRCPDARIQSPSGCEMGRPRHWHWRYARGHARAPFARDGAEEDHQSRGSENWMPGPAADSAGTESFAAYDERLQEKISQCSQDRRKGHWHLIVCVVVPKLSNKAQGRVEAYNPFSRGRDGAKRAPRASGPHGGKTSPIMIGGARAETGGDPVSPVAKRSASEAELVVGAAAQLEETAQGSSSSSSKVSQGSPQTDAVLTEGAERT
ncbi:hypothetical protein B0H14DRAFT_2659153 [Mycena olivaceomarginata]|nr:hypothetical protein B0H14DRAFT_2659153 [Mycena olivaceomarginata]